MVAAGKDISGSGTNFKSKKQSYCFQAVLASVNIVSQEEIINVPKKANLLHKKQGQVKWQNMTTIYSNNDKAFSGNPTEATNKKGKEKRYTRNQ